MDNLFIKQQFNKQAKKFSNWTINQNVEYLKAYYDFCKIKPNDTLLDVACGTGEYSIYAAHKTKVVYGIDISDEEIEIAKTYAKKFKLSNIKFICQDVENLPCDDHSFSVVSCKSAFHHFTKPDIIFNEMVRCSSGKVCIQDIVSYPDERVNDFFQKFEQEVDCSHIRTLGKAEFHDLYKRNNIRIDSRFAVHVELNLNEYLQHAVQTEENIRKINKLLLQGLKDDMISAYFFHKGDELYFRREVYLLMGEKKL